MARPKKLNADYFSHDKDMRNNLKIKAIIRKFNLEGYAVWVMFLETLTNAENFKLEWNELSIELIAADFGIDTERLQEITEYCIVLKLLEIEEGKIYSQSLIDRFEGLLSKRNRDRDGKREIKELSPSKTILKAVIPNESTQSKVEESKVNKTKVNNILLEKEAKQIFEEWIEYRKEIKKPIKSQKTIEALAEKIQSEGAERSKEVIQQSIENGWQGLFWDKQNNTQKNNQTNGGHKISEAMKNKMSKYD